MEDKNKKILTETVQFYFGQREIPETVQFKFHERETGRVMVELHTASLIVYKDLVFIEKLVWALMPVGINYELINVVKNVQGDSTNKREFANIDTSSDVTMFPDKKKE